MKRLIAALVFSVILGLALLAACAWNHLAPDEGTPTNPDTGPFDRPSEYRRLDTRDRPPEGIKKEAKSKGVQG